MWLREEEFKQPPPRPHPRGPDAPRAVSASAHVHLQFPWQAGRFFESSGS